MDLISIGSALYPHMRYALLIFIFSLSGYAGYRRYFYDKYPIRLPMFIFLMKSHLIPAARKQAE